MRLPRPGRVLQSVLLLLLCTTATNARPQQQQSTTVSNAETTTRSQVTPEGKQLTQEDAFFAPDAWRPVVSGASSPLEHRLHIDQDRSRVRLEKGDDVKQRGGKNQNTAETKNLATAPNSTASVVETSANNTGRAKQSSPLGDSIKSLANQLLGSHYFDKDSDESERDSDEDTSDSMVEEDVRTPPKLKSQIKTKQTNQHAKLPPKPLSATVESQSYEATAEETNHKGIAVPVIIEDDEDVEKTMEKLSYPESVSTPRPVATTTQKKKPATTRTTTTTTTTTTPKPYYETTSSDGVSTWVLLSGSSPTTPSSLPNKRKNNNSPTPSHHKTTHTTPAAEVLKTASSYAASSGSTKVPFPHNSISGPPRIIASPLTSTRKPVRTTTQAHVDTNPTNFNKNETFELFKPSKTRKPNPTRITTIKTMLISTTPTSAPASISTRRRPVVLETTKTQNRVTTIKPPVVTIFRHPEIAPSPKPSTTVAFNEDKTVSSTESDVENSTDVGAETTTKRTRRPTGGNKKRKKNKNRRRRPTKKPDAPDDLESKTDDVNATATNNKVATKERPLSTRIYNYLAREVMPSVGVGLLGLVVTAGLAGLIMYPFGGGLAARRTYEETGPAHRVPPNGYYHHGGEVDSGQSEEEVFGKLLEGMNDKGEFTYSGIGDETTGYAGVSGIGGEMVNEQNSRYKTGSSRVEDGQTYSPSGEVMPGIRQDLRYGGGRIDDPSKYDNRMRYDSPQQGAAGYAQAAAGPGDNKSPHSYVHGNQPYGGNLRTDNAQDRYQYSGMATRSGEIGETIRETQPLYSGSVNAATKQYTVGSVHVDTNPHRHSGSVVNSDISAYGAPYYSSYLESQPYTRNVYDGLTAVGGQTYGNVQVDSKSGTHIAGSVAITEKPPGTKQKTVSIVESKSVGNQQYRRGVSESRQQYRDVIGTQPRSGGTIVTISVTRQPGTQGKEEQSETKQPEAHQRLNDTKDGHNTSQGIPEIQKNQTAGNQLVSDHETSVGYGGVFEVDSDISTRLSPELQKRGSLLSGFVEHGPRSLRRRRDVTNSLIPSLPDDDFRDNEIDSDRSKLQETGKTEHPVVKVPHGIENVIPLHTTPESTGSITNDKQNTGEKLNQNSERVKAETISTTSTPDGDLTTDPVEHDKEIDFATISPTESTTLEDDMLTTEEDDVDIEEDEGDYETTVSPETTTMSDDTATEYTNIDSTTKIPDTQFSLLGLFRRIARYKLRMGLNLLKSTSQALTNYIERVQKRIDKDTSLGRSHSRRLKRAMLRSKHNAKKLEEKLESLSKKQHTNMFKTIQRAVGI